MTLLGCQVCGKVFKGRVYKYGYTDKACSPDCKDERRKTKFIIKKCSICKTWFRSYRSLKRITCSRPCKLLRQYPINNQD